MGISAVLRDPRVADVHIGDEAITVSLRDGRRISAPLDWFPKLKPQGAKIGPSGRSPPPDTASTGRASTRI